MALTLTLDTNLPPDWLRQIVEAVREDVRAEIVAEVRDELAAGTLHDRRRLIRTAEVRELLGMSKTAFQRIRSGELEVAEPFPEAVYFGGVPRWRRGEVEDWIEANRGRR